jgi:hypothetical protein
MQPLQPAPATAPASSVDAQAGVSSLFSAQDIEDVLLNAEDHMALGMWEEATSILDTLPEDLLNLPHVALVRIDLFIGQELWERGLMLGMGLVESNAHDAELWLRIARLMAGVGKPKSALRAAARCAELEPDFFCFMSEDRLLGPLIAEATSGPPASTLPFSCTTIPEVRKSGCGGTSPHRHAA